VGVGVAVAVVVAVVVGGVVVAIVVAMATVTHTGAARDPGGWGPGAVQGHGLRTVQVQ